MSRRETGKQEPNEDSLGTAKASAGAGAGEREWTLATAKGVDIPQCLVLPLPRWCQFTRRWLIN